MAADKKAIDFGKIKRYIKNRTSEFYIETLSGSDKEDFKLTINYINNVRKTRDLAESYDVDTIEQIKNRLTEYSPTREQQQIIDSINRQKKEDNIRLKKSRTKRKVTPPPSTTTKPTYEKVSNAFWDLKTLLEEEGKLLTSKEIEVVKKNMVILTNFIDTTLQERFKYEIQLALKQAEEIKMRIEKLNSKIKP
ncbi:hypothetical protein AGMMS49574_07740 [Bacteroidia bacterium]|nr:hypothetical protein AGMMS49574_07740 [Bacteroidia bacterium]GHU56999.1 hypothetical protein FACS189411_09250 [Bacteroidia bacterium]